MDKRKAVIFFALIGIVDLICIALAFQMVEDNKNFTENANLDSSEDGNADYLDFSGHYVRTGYYLREDGGVPFILDKDEEDCPILLHTMDNNNMFLELMSGDLIMIASDEGQDDSFPPSTGAYACVLLKKGTEDTKFLPEIQKALSGEIEELGWTFKNNWRK